MILSTFTSEHSINVKTTWIKRKLIYVIALEKYKFKIAQELKTIPWIFVVSAISRQEGYQIFTQAAKKPSFMRKLVVYLKDICYNE